MPAAEQSQIRIGWVGVPRSTPDYFPLEVLNTILGGSFTSRLNQNLREEHGYSYGASSRFDMRLSAGRVLRRRRRADRQDGRGAARVLQRAQRHRHAGGRGELAKAKNYVALGFPSEFETIGDLSAHLEELVVYKLPDNYFAQYIANIQAVTAGGGAEGGGHLHPAGQVRGGRRRRPQGDRAGHARAQSGAGADASPWTRCCHEHHRRVAGAAGLLGSRAREVARVGASRPVAARAAVSGRGALSDHRQRARSRLPRRAAPSGAPGGRHAAGFHRRRRRRLEGRCSSTRTWCAPTSAASSPTLDDAAAAQPFTFTIPTGPFTMTRRKLARMSCCTRCVIWRRWRLPPGRPASSRRATTTCSSSTLTTECERQRARGRRPPWRRAGRPRTEQPRRPPDRRWR